MATKTSVQSNLNRKREAIDFFFNEYPLQKLAKVPHQSDNLVIVLKSSHTYSSIDNQINRNSIITYDNCYDCFFYIKYIIKFMREFLKFFGILNETSFNNNRDQNVHAIDEDDEQFIRYHKELNILPYNNRRNLLKMKRRLESDGGSGGIVGPDSSQLVKIKKFIKINNNSCQNLINLAKKCHQFSTFKDISLLPSNRDLFNNQNNVNQNKNFPIMGNKIDKIQIKSVQVVGHFNKMNLIGQTKFSDHLQDLNQLELLIYHPFIEKYIVNNNNHQFCKLSFESNSKFIKSNKLVDCLYEKIFNLNHLYDSFEVKLSKLLNKCDYDFILNFIKTREIPKDCQPFFKLDPYLDLELNSDYDDNNNIELSTNKLTIREKLLIWRWVNNLNNKLIQLNENEIIKNYSFQINIENFKFNQLNKIQKLKPANGYKLIEQLRYLAIEYIKKFEIQLNELIRFNNENNFDNNEQSTLVDNNNNDITRAKDLLNEPKIKFIDLSNSLVLIRGLMPKRSAKRPLMPKRQSKSLNYNNNFNESNVDKLTNLIVNNLISTTKQNQQENLIDLENQVVSQWRSYNNNNNNNNKNLSLNNINLNRNNKFNIPLQLVVTIQQATNIPMRLNYFSQYQQQPTYYSPNNFRSQSPFLSPSPISVNNFNQQSILSNANYLTPPTTYVEIIFQRYQKTSSLSQGKNPSWNETLFFPINTNQNLTTTTTTTSSSDGYLLNEQSSLIDEYLQLNLYDYNCYMLQNNNDTLAIGNQFVENNRGTSLLSSMKQKVERHLLGSLRIPLTTLLTNGKIQGSFPLSQPMFLDNYQFQPEPTGIIMPPNNNFLFDKNNVNNNNSTTREQMMIMMMQTSKGDPFQTYINLFITIDPPTLMMNLNQQLYFNTGSHEQDNIFEYARYWEQVLTKYNFYKHGRHLTSSTLINSPDDFTNSSTTFSGVTYTSRRRLKKLSKNNSFIYRNIRTLVMQNDAKYCLIIRLITPLIPPIDLINSPIILNNDDDNNNNNNNNNKDDDSKQEMLNKQMFALARFVSLLKPLKYGLFNVRLLASSLWFDSIQLINQFLGGYEEKAILLCNYFLYLGKCSAILLGDSILNGRSIYVIVWQEQSRSLIEDQLELQARNLTIQLREVAIAASSSDSSIHDNFNLNEQQKLNFRKPVDQFDFISRLPILINSKSIQLWDVENGKNYFLNDYQSIQQQLQLFSIGSIITCENVYANIQIANNILETNFDIRLKHFWYPLFDGSLSLSSNSLNINNRGNNLFKRQTTNLNNRITTTTKIQLSWRKQFNQLELMRKQIGRPILHPIIECLNINDQNYFLNKINNYEKFSIEQCNELKENIEKNIKASLLKWRPNRPTYFNRTLSRLLSEKLSQFENLILTNQNNIDWKLELAELIKSEILMIQLSNSTTFNSFSPYNNNSNQFRSSIIPTNSKKIVSWPVNLTYTSMKTILDSLFASGVHNADLELLDNITINQQTTTQFLISCHIHPYPAKVMSVWLHVAAIITTNNNANLGTTRATTPIN